MLSAEFRTIDGTGNNPFYPDWGSTGVQLLRTAPVEYGDGIASPAGAGRAGPRDISNAVAAQPEGETDNERYLSDFIYAWGQFLDHDLDLTRRATGSLCPPPETVPPCEFNIPVPAGDPFFDPPPGTGTQVIPLNRSEYDPATGTDSPRQQINELTAWIDGSVVYGSDAARAAALRTFVGGKLKTSDGNLLPFNADGLTNANDAHRVPDDQLFLAGDIRANENIELTAMHTLFVREHNRLADGIAAAYPSLSDEEIYQQARMIVGAEIQAITYNEFLPALLGPYALRPYFGYKPWVNPGIANEFSTAGFRVGHTLLGDEVEFLDNQGEELREPVSLAEAFFNPTIIEETGIDPILKYLASDNAQEVDTKLVDSVRNFLFGPPGAGGLDLASLNIQRGRDHGLADYNAVRAAYGLPRVQSFAEITSNPELRQSLSDLYGSVDNIDLWVGGLAEDHVPGASVGPLIRRILARQFERLRDGDRFWYQRALPYPLAASVQTTTLADVIRRNTEITNLQDNVFFFRVTISGRVFDDRNRDGQQGFFERGLAGRIVQLLDGSGAVLATTTTDLWGSYRFTGLELGTYRVRLVQQPGWTPTTTDPADIEITRGMTVRNVNFGVTAVRTGFGFLPPRRPPVDYFVGAWDEFLTQLYDRWG